MTGAPTRRPAWSLTPAPVAADVEIAARQRLFIGGCFVTPRSRRHRDVIDPARGDTISRTTDGSPGDVDAAVEAAAAAQRAWARADRVRPLLRFAERLEAETPALAALIARETGRPIRAATAVDVPLAVRIASFNAGWADKLRYLVRSGAPRPAGVAGVIVSGDAALARAAWALMPALAAGCPCVLKPAPRASLACLHLAEIARAVDLPAGVLNVVTGGAKTGAALAAHAGVRVVVVSGRREACRGVRHHAAARDAVVALEARAPITHLLFDDASLDQAVEAIVVGPEASPLATAGLGTRVLVQEPVRAEVTARLLDRLRSRRVGDPLDANTDVGPLPSAEHAIAIDRMVEAICAAGGAIRSGGDPAVPPPTGAGHWCPPQLVTDVSARDALAFAHAGGPVVCMDTFRTTVEAVGLAGDATTLAVWSDKSARLFAVTEAVTEAVTARTVWANTLPQVDPGAPGAALGGLGVRVFLRGT